MMGRCGLEQYKEQWTR